MAVVTLSLKDDLHQRIIDEHSATNPNRALVELITRFVDYPPSKRTLFFTDEQRGALEKIYGEPIDKSNVDRFIDWIRRRAMVCVGEIEVPLSAAQLKRAETNAMKVGSRDGQGVGPEAVATYVRGLVGEAVKVALGA